MLVQPGSSRRTLVVVGAVVALTLLIACVTAAIALSLVDAPDFIDGQSADTSAALPAGDGEVLVTVFDVGQGQAVAVIMPDGSAALIDSGRSQARIEDDVVPYLVAHGVERLDYLILSHPDQDHVGGMPQVIEMLPVGAWVDPAIPSTNQTYARTLEMLLDAGIPAIMARRGESIELGPGVTLELLWPVDAMLESGGEVDSNENSAVVRVRIGDVVILDPGDLEQRGEAELIEREGEDLLADVLIVGHHGSNSSSTAAFLDALDGDVAIISAGLNNQYGHPHDEVLQRLRFRGYEIYRTDLDGTIEIRSDGSEYTTTALGTEEDP